MHVKNMYQGHLKILYNKRNLFFLFILFIYFRNVLYKNKYFIYYIYFYL